MKKEILVMACNSVILNEAFTKYISNFCVFGDASMSMYAVTDSTLHASEVKQMSVNDILNSHENHVLYLFYYCSEAQVKTYCILQFFTETSITITSNDY